MAQDRPTVWTTAVATAVALTAFAGNSALCRAALRTAVNQAPAIDAASFTAVRLFSGALFLAPALFRSRHRTLSPVAATALFTYACTFSFSYIWLPTGVGALLLFGFVQCTMVGSDIIAGRRPSRTKLAWISIAAVGVVVLVAPSPDSTSSVSAAGAILMAIAGVAWGVYSLKGQGLPNPIATTALNFIAAAPLSLVPLALVQPHWSTHGVLLAATSGAITSGAGYAVWYYALRGHSATSAATVQLLVPVLAAAAGVTLMGELVTIKLALSTLLVLGGVGMALRKSA